MAKDKTPEEVAADLAKAEKKSREQLKKIRQAKERLGLGPSGGRSREQDAERKRAQSTAKRLVEVPRCADRERREAMEADHVAWLRYYFGDECSNPFWYEFTSQQQEMIAAISHAIYVGGDQAIAASRGEGKTTLCERLLLKFVLQGEVNFAVLFASTGPMATNSIDSIKADIEENDRLLADYPEVCVPVRALENTPQRAQYQIVSGWRHDNGERYESVPDKFSWCGNEVILPNVPGSPAAGHIIATRGLDAAVRGLKKKGKRPRVAIIDDPDTEETSRSETQAAKLEDRIDKGIGGLGGQQRAIGRVMLTTLQSRTSVSFKFTSTAKPTWKGKRFRYLLKPPNREDLWDEYIMLRHADYIAVATGESDDEFCRRSHQFFLDNRKEMEAGAEVANEHRFDGTVLPDGTSIEESSLQHYYNEVARLGPEAVATEYDNDPPEFDEGDEHQLTAIDVQRQVSGYPQGVIPPGCTAITQGIDCRKVALHWVVRAWRDDCTSFVIDYGVEDVTGTTIGSDVGVEMALLRAIRNRFDYLEANPYKTVDDEPVPIHLSLIDAGWMTPVIYQACEAMGTRVRPMMGFGKSQGAVQAKFDGPTRTTKDRKPGDGWFLKRQQGKHWLVCADADRWKAFEHARWLTPPGKPGATSVWGIDDVPGDRLSTDQKAHYTFGRHITAEAEVEDFDRGRIRRHWKANSNNNHWLDASYMTSVAANMLGIRVLVAGHGGEAPKLTTAQKAAQAAAEIQPQPEQSKSNGAAEQPGGWFKAQKKRKR